MTNPLLSFWRQVFGIQSEAVAHPQPRRPLVTPAQSSATIFLVLRRMRAPLIGLILIFAVSVLGLTLIPGQDANGQTSYLSFFDAFYFMSFTATTIGFGELPHTFTDAQRMWVIASIYLTVIGWAYTLGSLFALLQDRAFRDAIARQRFTRRVARIREPFLLIAGYGKTGEMLGRSLDVLGRRFVVLDDSQQRIDSLELESYHADVPGLVADVRDPGHLGVAGLAQDNCEGVLALTNNDEVNLAVTMSAALLRPDLPVIARTVSPAVEERMHAFGTPTVVNPFDRFGDQLRLALRAPASYQLLTWLESGLGADLPTRGHPPRHGRWVICGYGRFGRELAADLRSEGLEVTVIDPNPEPDADPSIVVGDGSDPSVMALAHLQEAVGFVAGTDNDTTNLSLIAAAGRINPKLFVVARQNEPANAPLFAAMTIDSVLVPTEMIAHEVYAKLSTPLLWHFLQQIPAQGDAWAVDMIELLSKRCGKRLHTLWKSRLTTRDAPALVPRLESGQVTLGHLLRYPDDRDRRLEAVPLLLLRQVVSQLAPGEDVVLRPGDEVLFAGHPFARRAIETTLFDEVAVEWQINGRHMPVSWIWRRLATRA